MQHPVTLLHHLSPVCGLAPIPVCLFFPISISISYSSILRPWPPIPASLAPFVTHPCITPHELGRVPPTTTLSVHHQRIPEHLVLPPIYMGEAIRVNEQFPCAGDRRLPWVGLPFCRLRGRRLLSGHARACGSAARCPALDTDLSWRALWRACPAELQRVDTGGRAHMPAAQSTAVEVGLRQLPRHAVAACSQISDRFASTPLCLSHILHLDQACLAACSACSGP